MAKNPWTNHLATWLISGLTISASAQFINPSPDVFTTVDGPLGTKIRFKEVATGPGSICELHSGVKSYSGYVDVSPHKHVFFWFFEARDVDPQEAPLAAWLSGGPGVASMDELFTEHGPCKLDSHENVSSNPYTWNARSNTVYIDQPISVGFSYSEAVPSYVSPKGCKVKEVKDKQCPAPLSKINPCSDFGPGLCGTLSSQNPDWTDDSSPKAAETFWLALQGFYSAFPQYSNGWFTLASESYGGHYAPIFARHIYDQNQKRNSSAGLSDSIEIPLKSVLVTNGWFDPAVAYEAQYQFLVEPGNTYGVRIPQEAGEKMRHALYGPNQCLDRLKKCNSPDGTDKICRDSDTYCSVHVQSSYHRTLHRSQYDVRELNPNPFPNVYHIGYLNRQHVQQELGVVTNYTEFSSLIDSAFYRTGDDGKEFGITQSLALLLDSGVSVTLQHGDADYDCNWFGGEKMWYNIASESQTPSIKSGYNATGFRNLTTPDGVWHGQVKQIGSLTFVRVFESGHEIGFFQPAANQAIFERTIAGLDVSTGQVDVTKPVDGKTYQSQGPKISTYAEGNATVQYHRWPENSIYNYTTNEPMLPQRHETNSASMMSSLDLPQSMANQGDTVRSMNNPVGIAMVYLRRWLQG